MDEEKKVPAAVDTVSDVTRGELVNVSGHMQELDRTFSIWSICGMAIMSDDAWAAGGATLVIA